MDKEELDLLKKAEDVTDDLNRFFHRNGKSVFNRYPVMFALFVILGGTLLSQGIKELIFEVPFLKENPSYMFLSGLLVLIVTGKLYKKLDK